MRPGARHNHHHFNGCMGGVGGFFDDGFAAPFFSFTFRDPEDVFREFFGTDSFHMFFDNPYTAANTGRPQQHHHNQARHGHSPLLSRHRANVEGGGRRAAALLNTPPPSQLLCIARSPAHEAPEDGDENEGLRPPATFAEALACLEALQSFFHTR
ncbi:hypothetical protein HPB49_001913 [Dermacentor silvarum]|uniref:Uncharacterized protein n=1 Tax=Dermacentor silvarum TaxID=543639 RepID=A0ACB8D9Z8_DERSI|nr:hypothetical protein HPB49_001913 [Dermacentor silvarum]